MHKISELTKLEIKEEEGYLKCEDDKIVITCHLNPEGYAFILAKTDNQTLLDTIEETFSL